MSPLGPESVAGSVAGPVAGSVAESVAESAPPTRTDPVVAAASEVIGGPLGRYAAPLRHPARSLWQPAAAVLVGLSSLTVALGVLQKAHCFGKGWSTPDQFWHACYSDLPAVYQTSGLGHAMPYLPGAQPLDQPVITGVVMWLVGLVVPDGSALVQQQWYFALWAALVTVIVMALVAVTAASVPAAPWRAAHFALSPVLVLAGLVSVDLLGILLASAALLAWGRGKIALAGLILGLAISARTYPLVLLVAIGLLAVRSGSVQAWVRLAGTALVTWFAVSLPWLVMNADALLSVYRTWWRSGPSYGSLWMLPSLLRPTMRPGILASLLGNGLGPGAVTALAILGWLVALAAGAVFALSLERRPAVAEISLVMLVIVLVTGKSVPVQAALWLLPLIALIGMQWRDHLIWAGFEATYFVAVWLYIAGLSKPDRGLPSRGYAVLLGFRLVAMLFLLVQVWRVARSREPVDPLEAAEASADADADADLSADAGGPETESDDAGAAEAEPKSGGVDADDAQREPVEEIDPLAGPMAGAPDAVLVRFG
ncbi:MAG: glycosyltransferase 87 family protein [Dermatophilaceae bacterium]